MNPDTLKKLVKPTALLNLAGIVMMLVSSGLSFVQTQKYFQQHPSMLHASRTAQTEALKHLRQNTALLTTSFIVVFIAVVTLIAGVILIMNANKLDVKPTAGILTALGGLFAFFFGLFSLIFWLIAAILLLRMKFSEENDIIKPSN